MELDLFRIPSSSRVLLLSAIFSLTSALPRPGPDVTASYEPADWNPRPTNVPQSLPELLKRDASVSSICGWFNGDLNDPSACSSDQKCVYDTNHAMVGCCPLSDSCTTGVYTTCVNFEQGALNPTVLTCSGDSVCYQNTYPGGYYQYGCGASTDGQTVATTYSGQGWSSQLEIFYTQLTLATTEPATSIVPSTTAMTQSSFSSSSSSPSFSTASSASSSVSSSSSPSSIASNSLLLTTTGTSSQAPKSTSISAGALSVTNTSAATVAATDSGSQVNVGIIAGSVVGGVGVMLAIMALACVLMRRRRNRKAEEWARSIAPKEKTMSVSSYASSQISGHARIHHPFSPDDIVSPLTPPQQVATTLVPPMVIIHPAEEEYSMVQTEDSKIEHIQPGDDPIVQQPMDTERSNIRRVQLVDGPSIDDIVDLPPPWVRPPTPPPRSPKRLTMRIHPPEDHTPLDIYLKSQFTPIHHSVSVTSNTSDASRYSRTTDGRSMIENMNGGSWQREEAPPVPIIRKPVGSGWYRTMAPLMEKKPDDHVAFQIAGDSDVGRSLTAPQHTRERSLSMPFSRPITESLVSQDSVMSATNHDIHELDITGKDGDWVAPLRLNTSSASPVTKRGRTPVPILGVPAAPLPGGRGSRLYEV